MLTIRDVSWIVTYRDVEMAIFFNHTSGLLHLPSANHRPIKQADTILLTYPLNWNMSRDIMKNDLLFYEDLTDLRTPALTWSFFTVGFKWVNEDARMQNYFLKSYQDYVIQPFKVSNK